MAMRFLRVVGVLLAMRLTYTIGDGIDYGSIRTNATNAWLVARRVV
jgi:hypothetical protein